MSDREKVIEGLTELIEQGEKFVSTSRFVAPQASGECQYWFSRLVSQMDSISPEKSFYNQELLHLIQRSNRQGGIYQEDIQRIVGHLKFLRDAVNDGLLLKIEDAITASDYSDFLNHARSYHTAQQKIQAAVIASAVFEDVVRRIGRKHGLSGQDNLETIINALKSSNVITKNEAK